MKPIALVTVGIPGSGKTTAAWEFIQDNPNTEIACRDDIRMMIDQVDHYHDYKYSKEKEKKVTEEQERIIITAAKLGKNVVIPDTNLTKSTRDRIIGLVENLGFDVRVEVFHIPFEEAVKRDEKRKDKTVGRQVIWRMYLKYLNYIGRRTYIPDEALPTAFIFDIDGTLASHYDGKGNRLRSPFDWDKVGNDIVNEHVAMVLDALWEKGHYIILLSGRDGVCREKTEEWLKDNEIRYDEFFIREPGNNEKDNRLKERLFFDHIAPRYNVKGVFDDRNQVAIRWRELGVPLFKVGCPVEEF